MTIQVYISCLRDRHSSFGDQDSEIQSDRICSVEQLKQAPNFPCVRCIVKAFGRFARRSLFKHRDRR
jgi:hypothetical protein